MTPEPLLTAEEVAGVLKVSLARVKKWTATGKLPSIRLGSLHRYRPELARAPLPAPVRPEPGAPLLADFLACEGCGWRAPASRTAAPITQMHHIVRRQEGGSNAPANLVRLCPNCHVIAHGCLYRVGEEQAWPRDRAAILGALADLYGREPSP